MGFRQHLSRPARAAIAGSMAGISLICMPSSSQMPICMFFFVRALEIVVKYTAQKGYIPLIPHPDVCTMALSSAQVLWGWLFHRNTLDPTYLRFLDIHGAKQMLVQESFSTLMANGQLEPDLLEKLNKNRLELGFKEIPSSLSSPSSQNIFCEILHPSTLNCFNHYFMFLKQAFFRSFPVYLPVYLIPLVIFRYKKMLNNPLDTLTSTTISICRSSFFLATYTAGAWITACMGHKYVNYHATPLAYFCGFFSGSMVILEKKHRRIELCLYVLGHGIRSFWNTYSKRFLGGVQLPQTAGTILLFSVSIGVILTAYINQHKLLRSSYFSLLIFFFGSGGRSQNFPQSDEKIAKDQRQK